MGVFIDTVFLKILDMSFMASWMMIAVILLRLLLKKAPKWIVCMLWILVGIRLICPFSMESAWSLIPSSEPVSEVIKDNADALGVYILSEFNMTDVDTFEMNPTNMNESETGMPRADVPVTESVNPDHMRIGSTDEQFDLTQIGGKILGIVWLTGTALMLFYGFISYYRLHRITAASMEISEGTDKNIFQCDAIDTPFILGIIRPRIYLPSHMEDSWTDYVIAHEKAHIRHHDHWWKPMGFLILSMHWFNLLCWFSYILLCRDIELACDESVIKTMDSDSKKIYAKALLSCSVKQRIITACPLAFGEVGIKERIRSVMNYKKPAFWIVAVSLIACVVVAVCFLSNPKTVLEDNLPGGIREVEGSIFEYGYDKRLEGVVIIKYIGGSESVVIPEMIDGYPVVKIGSSAFYQCDDIISVTIPDSVTVIESHAFMKCSNLEEVNISDNVTSIGNGAFNSCYHLKNITIPNGVTALNEYVFNGCYGFTDIVIPDSVTVIGKGAFMGCGNLESITIPDSVTFMDILAFADCTSLTEVVLPDSLTEIPPKSFTGCESLTNIVIPDSVKSFGAAAFRSCNSLTSITIPDSVISINDGAFESCGNLTSVIIPDNISFIGQEVFAFCSNLKNVNIPDNVFLVAYNAFAFNNGLTVTYRGREFESSQFEDLYEIFSIDGFYFTLNADGNGLLIDSYRGNDTSIQIPESFGGVPVVGIGYSAFEGNEDLESVIIPEGVTSINGEAFAGCSNLSYINIPDSITYIADWSLSGCMSLKSLSLPDNITSFSTGVFGTDEGFGNTTIIYQGREYNSSNYKEFYELFGIPSWAFEPE